MTRAIYRGRRSLLYQFPVDKVYRNTNTDLYERVFRYLDRDPDDPNRAAPPPPSRVRVRRALQEAAGHFAATVPRVDDTFLDNLQLVAPMAAEAEVYPATFYCTSCGRIAHAEPRERDNPDLTRRVLLERLGSRTIWRCQCGGDVTQWRFLSIHPGGFEQPTVEAANIACPDHGTRSLHLSNFHLPQIQSWRIQCRAPGCHHEVNGIRGRMVSNRELETLPEESRQQFRQTFQISPVERATALTPRILTLPFATDDLRPPQPGSSQAIGLVQALTGATGPKPADWRSRAQAEQDLILEALREGRADNPQDAEDLLVRLHVLEPIAQTGNVDPRATDEAALEEARIIERVRREGTRLEGHGGIHRITHHSAMPVSTILYGRSRAAGNAAESVLRAYMRRREGQMLRPAAYYHTGDVETLLVEFGASEPASRTALHTRTHALIRSLGESSGYSESDLVEYLLPAFNAALIYPSNASEVVLGMLRVAWDQDAGTILSRASEIVDICPADPFCREQGAACSQCVMLPPHCCQEFNANLDRRTPSPN